MSIGRTVPTGLSVIGRGPFGGSGGGGGSGETNIGQNVNTEGVGVYSGKSSVILQFRGLFGEQDTDNILPWGVFKVENNGVAQLDAGYAVTADGVDASNIFEAVYLDPNIEAHRANYLGILADDVAPGGGIGYAIRFGAVLDLDTSGMSVLDSLFVSDSTPGLIDNVDPGGDTSFNVGMVRKVDALTGIAQAIPGAGGGGGSPFDWVDYNPQSSDPAYEAGREWFDGATPWIWTHVPGIKVQRVGEIPRQVWNDTGVEIPVGKAVSFDDVYFSPTAGPIASVHLTDANSEADKNNYMGLTKAAIPTYVFGVETGEGIAVREGFIPGVDTSGWAAKSSLWVDAANPGDLIDSEPLSPAYSINVGVVPISAVNGALGAVAKEGGNKQTSFDIYVGMTLTKVGVIIESTDGLSITCTIENQGGGNIVYYKTGGILFIYDSTPAVTISLTPGTDSVPAYNYAYIDHTDDTFKHNLTGFPTDRGVTQIWKGRLQSAATTQTYGPRTTQRTSNEQSDPLDSGHWLHIMDKIREDVPSTYRSGGVLTPAGSGGVSVLWSMSAIIGRQVHLQSGDAIPSPAPFWVVNDPTQIEQIIDDWGVGIPQDENGDSLNNKWFYVFVYYNIPSPDSSEGKMCLVLPTGSYSTKNAALVDNDNTQNFSFPAGDGGTAIPLEQWLCFRSNSENLTLDTQFELRGKTMQSLGQAGGGQQSGGVTWPVPASVYGVSDTTDPTKVKREDVSLLTTSNERMAYMPDKDGIYFDAQDIQAGPVNVTGRAKNDVLMWNGTEHVYVPEGTTFTFSIATFTDDESASIIEIGAAGTWKAIGAIEFSASYNNGPPSAAPTVQLSGQFAAWVAALDMTTGPGYTGPTASLEAIAYPSSPSSSYGYITLSATDGVDPDTHVNYFRFYDWRSWGVDTDTSLDAAGVQALAGQELSNSQVKTFTVDLSTDKYGYYCIRAALPDPVFYVGGFLGGVSKLTSTLSITNSKGYTENYKVFRTDNFGLGVITIEARAS